MAACNFEYVDKQIIPRFEGDVDHGVDAVVVALFPCLGTRLIWQYGAKYWTNRTHGYAYFPGHYKYQTVGSYWERNRGDGIDRKLYLSAGDGGTGEEVARLNNECVQRMLVKVASLNSAVYQCVEANAKYKRGKTIVFYCQTSDQMLDSLASSIDKL
jgi:hypothetical protein